MPSAPALSPRELADLVAHDRLAEEHGPAVVVDLSRAGPTDTDLGSTPCVVVGIGADNDEQSAAIDVLAADDRELAELLGRIEATPTAATALAVLLRLASEVEPELGLAAESAVYSTLQSGPEFEHWRAARSPRAPDGRDAGRPAVATVRDGPNLHITLDRPWKHNAFNTAMRDALAEALTVPVVDDTVEHILLDGNGPSFCSGGDLDEFGTRPDPATAHRTRLTRSPARLLWRLRARSECTVHGACLGAGIELAAVASRVRAHPDTRFALPELGLGLVPGAGGTVSLPRRIGRQRTAWLALTTTSIDAATAFAWGLIDEIV
jgi:hypothetical protein